MSAASVEQKSHSQYGEDKYICEIFAGSAPGRFLEIGAWNPFDKSNSRALYEAGWGGVLIEPSPLCVTSLIAEYGNDPRVTIIQAAMGFETHMAKLYVTADAVSTTEEKQYRAWREHAKYNGAVWVPQVRWEDVINQFGGFDFVSIDTEGTSVDLFCRMVTIGYLPKCVCLEHDNRIVEANKHAEAVGYRQVHLNGTNVVFAL